MLRGSWSQVSNAEAAKRQEAGNRYLFDVADPDNANITHHAVDGLTMRKDSWVSSVQAATTYEAQNTMFIQIGATICLKGTEPFCVVQNRQGGCGRFVVLAGRPGAM